MKINTALVLVLICSFCKNISCYFNDTQVSSHRDGKFLFDALFGLGEELDLTDGDNKLTKCDCGKWCFKSVYKSM
jgi:hypothetical protein